MKARCLSDSDMLSQLRHRLHLEQWIHVLSVWMWRRRLLAVSDISVQSWKPALSYSTLDNRALTISRYNGDGSFNSVAHYKKKTISCGDDEHVIQSWLFY